MLRRLLLATLLSSLAITAALAQGWPPRNGSTLPSTCTTGEGFFLTSSTSTRLHECTAENTWTSAASTSGQGAALPSGAIVLILSGTCPAGFTQETALNGRFVLGTVAANGDVGTTGGSDSITTVLNHTHPVTDPGHTHTLPVGATDDTSAPFDRSDAGTNASGANATTASGSSATGVTTANPAGGVASIDNRPAFVRVIFCRAN